MTPCCNSGATTQAVKTTVVLDASAVLALLNREPGYEEVAPLLASAVLYAVNYTEVYSVLCRHGYTVHEAYIILHTLDIPVVSFDAHQADIAGDLHRQGRPYQLSLADCVCLALAQHLACPVYTADRIWSSLSFVSMDIRQLRTKIK